MRIWALRRLRDSAGQYTASIAVVAVVSVFAVLLMETIDLISRVTAGVVVSNTFTTVYAGRLREIALLRLIGATSRQVRRTALLDGALVGLTGALLGVLAGTAISIAGIAALNNAMQVRLEFGIQLRSGSHRS